MTGNPAQSPELRAESKSGIGDATCSGLWTLGSGLWTFMEAQGRSLTAHGTDRYPWCGGKPSSCAAPSGRHLLVAFLRRETKGDGPVFSRPVSPPKFIG